MTPETCIKFMKTSELYLRMTEQKCSPFNQYDISPFLLSEYQIIKKTTNSMTTMRKDH